MSKYYTAPPNVIDGDVAFAADINDVNAEANTGFSLVEDDITNLIETVSQWADLAMKWAQEAEDVEVQPGLYSAYHWSIKAGDSATAASDSEIAAAASELLASRYAQYPEDSLIPTVGGYSALHWAAKAEDSKLAAEALFNTLPSTGEHGQPLVINSSLNGYVLGDKVPNKNLLINGDGSVHQYPRSTGDLISDQDFITDRWRTQFNKGSWNGVNDFFGSSNKFMFGILSVAGSGALGATDYVIPVQQQIEAVSTDRHLAAGGDIALSFDAVCSTPGTFAVVISVTDDSLVSRSIVKEFTLQSAGVIERVTVTTPVPAGYVGKSTILEANITVQIGAISGTTGQVAANTWSTTPSICTAACTQWSVSSGYFYAGRVQLEIGSYSSDFEVLPVQQVLAQCQRYYLRLTQGPIGFGQYNTATTYLANIPFPVPMRIHPSLGYSATTILVIYADNVTRFSSAIGEAVGLGTTSFELQVTTASLSIGSPGTVRVTAGPSNYIYFDAEI